MQFVRSDLLTEVVPDVDVMPVDPCENLPLTLASLPLLLNGRMNSSATGHFFRRRGGMVPARSAPPCRLHRQSYSRAWQWGCHLDTGWSPCNTPVWPHMCVHVGTGSDLPACLPACVCVCLGKCSN